MQMRSSMNRSWVIKTTAPGEFQEGFFKGFKCGDVEVVGGLIEKEKICGLEHEVGNRDAGSFSAGEFSDGHVEDVGGKEKPFAPAVHMDLLPLVGDKISFRGKSFAQGDVVGKLHAVLVEVDDFKSVGNFEGALIGCDFTGQEFEEGCFTGAVGAHESHAGSGGEDKVEVVKEQAAADRFCEVFGDDEFAGFPFGGGKIEIGSFLLVSAFDVGELLEKFMGVFDARAGF